MTEDLRYTLRTLRRDKGFTAFAILIVGLGIGASCTVFSVLNALLIAGSGALALLLWRFGKIEVGAIAMVLPLTLQLTNMSRQIAMRKQRELFDE